MGSKKIIYPVSLFSAQAVSSTTTYTSPSVNIQNLDNIRIQLSWTSSMVGTFSVWGSNDNITYNSYTFSPALAQPAGTAGGYAIEINQTGALWLYLQYVNTSSSGTITANLVAKDVN